MHGMSSVLEPAMRMRQCLHRGHFYGPIVLFVLLPNVNLAIACFQPSQRELFIFQALFPFSSDAESCGIFFSALMCAFGGYMPGLFFFLMR